MDTASSKRASFEGVCREAERTSLPLRKLVGAKIDKLLPLTDLGRSISSVTGNGHGAAFALRPQAAATGEDKAVGFWQTVLDLITEYEPSYPENADLKAAILNDDRLTGDGIMGVTEYRPDFSTPFPWRY